MRVFRGDLTAPGFGLARDEYDRLVHTTDSVIHCAASRNRKSEKSCLNVNLRGTLEVLTLARSAEHYHGLRRFSQVSTVAVAGKRHNEVVTEDRAIDWERSDYDPYARTKKFCEHMMRVLLPETPKTVFGPSIVLGDSRYAQTTQFDMVKAFVFLAGLPVLQFRPTDKISGAAPFRMPASPRPPAPRRPPRPTIARANKKDICAWVARPTPATVPLHPFLTRRAAQ